MSRNGSTVTINDPFLMFHISINKISKDLLLKQSSGGVLLKRFSKKFGKIQTPKIDLKINLKMNLKIDSSIGVYV